MKSLLFAVFLLATAARGQELDVFDINDFVDPRELGATIVDGRFQCPCRDFLVSRLMTGAAYEYVDLTRTTNQDAFFAHLATSYYTGPWQFNLKTSELRKISDEPRQRFSVGGLLPHSKTSLQLARYWAIGRQAERAVIRTQLNFGFIQYRFPRIDRRTGKLGSYQSRVDRELGLEIDTSLPVFGHQLNGSINYVGLIPSGAPFSEIKHLQRVTYVYRFPRWHFHRWSLDPTLAAGAVVKDNHWRQLTAIPSLHLMTPPIPHAGVRIHLRYEPNYQRVGPFELQLHGPSTYLWRTTKQFSVFIDRAIVTHAF
jgi:hypothetical protein